MTILSLLPIKEAARTSVLSNNWRYIWLSVPHLDLNEQLFLDSKSVYNTKRWIGCATSILMSRICSLSHDPILQCTIRVSLFNEYSLFFDTLLNFISAGGIVVLELHNNSMNHYNVCGSVYCCKTLQKQVLERSVVRPPPIFTGLRNLKSLHLIHVCISNNDLDLMLLSCVSLESLVLETCERLDNIVVCVPMLSEFVVFGRRPLSVSVAQAPRLTVFLFDVWLLIQDDDEVVYGTETKLLDLVELSNIEYLYAEQDLEDGLALRKDMLHVTQAAAFRLKLELSLPTVHAHYVRILSCLLNSSPNLLKLIIEDTEEGTESKIENDYWNKQKISKCFNRGLSSVHVKSIDLSINKFMIDFIKFLLINSSTLHRMKIKYRDTPDTPVLQLNYGLYQIE